MKRVAQAALLVVLVVGGFLAGARYTQRIATQAPPTGARKILYYVDPMHPAYTSDKPGIAPDCGMALVPVYEGDRRPEGGTGLQAGAPGSVSVRPEIQQQLGVRVEAVRKAAGTRTLRVVGRIAPDETRIYKVNAGVEGTIREVSNVTTGSRVRKDQWLASFFSIDTRIPIQGYLTALDVMDRVKRTGERPEQVLAGDANLQFSAERLQSVGMPPAQIEELRRTREVPQLTKIVAPTDGYVLARNVSLGQKFEKGAEWFRVADLSQVWIEADVFAGEARQLAPGMGAQVTLAGDPRTQRTARVSQVPSQFDAGTRTLKVRLEVDNPGALLRPDMFVDVTFSVPLPPAVRIPAEALLDSGLAQVVYVEREGGVFEPRPVKIGGRHDGQVEVEGGLAPGERIAVSGTFLLDSESRLRLAAAGAHHHGGAAPPAEAPRSAGPGEQASPQAEAHDHGHPASMSMTPAASSVKAQAAPPTQAATQGEHLSHAPEAGPTPKLPGRQAADPSAAHAHPASMPMAPQPMPADGSHDHGGHRP